MHLQRLVGARLRKGGAAVRTSRRATRHKVKSPGGRIYFMCSSACFMYHSGVIGSKNGQNARTVAAPLRCRCRCGAICDRIAELSYSHISHVCLCRPLDNKRQYVQTVIILYKRAICIGGRLLCIPNRYGLIDL